FLISGGSAQHPAHTVVKNNRAADNGLAALLVMGAGLAVDQPLGAGSMVSFEPIDSTDLEDTLDISVSDNDMSGHPFGVRFMELPVLVQDALSAGRVVAILENNII